MLPPQKSVPSQRPLGALDDLSAGRTRSQRPDPVDGLPPQRIGQLLSQARVAVDIGSDQGRG